MSFKKFLNSVIFAGAALTGGVQAQTSPVGGLTQNTAILANHALDQKRADPNIGKQFLVNNLKFSEKIGNTMGVGIIGEYDSKFGIGATVEATYNSKEESFAVGALYKKLQNARYTLAAVSKNWGSMNLTGTYSTGSQSAQKAIGREDIDGNLTGTKTTLSLTTQEVGFLDTLGIKLSRAKTNETILRQDNLITKEITRRELTQVIESIESTYDNITRTSWTGGTDDRVSLVGGMKISDHHRIDASIGNQVMRVLDTRRSYNIGSIGYTYVPTPDSKFNIQHSSSGQSKQTRAEFSHILANKQGEFVAGVRRDTYSNGIPSSNAIYAGLKLSFGGKNSSYSTASNRAPKNTIDNLRFGMNPSNLANPQEIGYVAVKQEKKLINETTTYAPKEVPTTFGKVTVNTNGTITVEFGNTVQQSSQKVLLAASSRSAINIPTSDIKFALKITKPNGGIDSIGINPPSWTSSVMEDGCYTLVIVTTNTVDGKQTKSESQGYVVTIEKDAKEDIKELEVVSTGYESALLNYSATDMDGVRNETWKIEGSTGATVEVDRDTRTIALKGAIPGSILTLVYEGEFAVKGKDGNLTWKTFKKTKEVTLLRGVDTVTAIALDVNHVTTNSILAACNIIDLDGATGTCTLRTKAGALVQSWSIGANQPIVGLIPNTEYTLALTGTADEKQVNNTIKKISINQLKDFTTNALGIDSPTVVTLSASAITTNGALAACNFTDLDGISGGTCTLSGGAGATSWTMGANHALSGLSAGTTYTLTVSGFKQLKNPDNSFSTVAVSQSTTFTTDVTNTAPTAIGFSQVTLTAGSLSVGQAVASLTCTDLESATCVYAITAQSSPGAFTVTSGGDAKVGNSGLVAGSYTVTLQATDGGGLTRSEVKTIIVDAAVVVDPTPTGPAISDIEVSDFSGGSPITPVNAGGVTDSLSRTITYSASGLPAGITINSSTGVITGMYDNENTLPGTAENFNVSVTATPAGGAHSLVRTFILGIRNDG